MDKSVLKRAIEDTPDPTPGYMYSEISGWTYLDRGTQEKMVYTLFDDKLATYKKKFCGSSVSSSSSGIHTVAKVLRIIKMVCETGHPDFQREVQRRVDEFIKCFSSQFRGTNPDPKMGERYNDKVRTNAKDAIEAAYSSQKKVTTGNTITAGFGNDGGKKEYTSGGWGASGATTVGGMISGWASSSSTPNVGDQRIASMPSDNKWASALQEKMDGVTASDKAAADLATKARLGFGFFGTETVQKHSAGSMPQFANDGGGFQAVDIALVPGGQQAGGFRWGATEPAGDADNGWGLPPVEERANLAGPEKPVVYMTPFEKVAERIVTMKNVPQRVELASFVAECKAVHEGRAEGCPGPSPYEQLAEALDKRLALKYPWTERLNVMTCLEHLLRNADMLLSDSEREQLIAAKKAAEAAEAAAAGDSKRAKKSVAMMTHLQYMQHLCSQDGDDNEEYSAASILTYFNENPEDVQRNIHVVQSSLKEKSKKVLALLGIPERVSGAAAVSTPTASSAAPVEADFAGMTVRKRKVKGGAEAEPTAPVVASSSPGSMGGSTSSLPSAHSSPPAPKQTGMFRRKQLTAEEVAPTPQPIVQQQQAATTSSGWGDDSTIGGGWGSSEGFGGGWGTTAEVTTPAPPAPAPAPPAPVVVAPTPTPAPTPVVVNTQQQKLFAIQQQFQELQTRMQAMMTSGNQSPEAMQALMTEQQQLMMTMMSLQQAPSA